MLYQITMITAFLSFNGYMGYLEYRDRDMPTTILQGLLLFLVLEASVFMNYKAKAQLFLRIKASEQQSEQLTDLLDTVPDSVYICSKS